jgi:hypothetical protein
MVGAPPGRLSNGGINTMGSIWRLHRVRPAAPHDGHSEAHNNHRDAENKPRGGEREHNEKSGDRSSKGNKGNNEKHHIRPQINLRSASAEFPSNTSFPNVG